MQKLYTVLFCLVQIAVHCANAMSGLSISQFIIDVVNKLSPKFEHQNIVISPTSLQMLLAVTSYAAEGDTFEEINKVACFMSETKFDIIPFCKEFYQRAFNDSNTRFQTASRFFVDKDYVIKSNFHENIVMFNSTAQNIEFIAEKETIDYMNAWIATHTENRIQHAIKESDINLDFGAILFDTIYFKSAWYNQFDPKLTTPGDFYVTPTETIQTPMMHAINFPICFAKYETLKVTIIEWGFADYINYDDFDTALKFSLLVPDEKDGLRDVESKLDLKTFKDIKAIRCELRSANITMPKFKIQSTIDWKQILQELGMKTLFETANFSNMIESGPKAMHVSDIRQTLTIEVNEKGIHSTSVSTKRANFTALPEAALNTSIVVDRPFIFTISSIYGIPLIGHVINPTL